MDEAIALVFLAPALLLGLWLMDFTGGAALADGRAQLAAYEGAATAAEGLGGKRVETEDIRNAADKARNAATIAMLDVCRDLDRNLVTATFVDAGGKEWTGSSWPQAPAGTVLDAVRVNVRCRLGASPIFDQWRTGESRVQIVRADTPPKPPSPKRWMGTSGQ